MGSPSPRPSRCSSGRSGWKKNGRGSGRRACPLGSSETLTTGAAIVSRQWLPLPTHMCGTLTDVERVRSVGLIDDGGQSVAKWRTNIPSFSPRLALPLSERRLPVENDR